MSETKSAHNSSIIFDTSSNLPPVSQKKLPFYKLDLARIVIKDQTRLAETRRGAKSKLKDKVKQLEHDVYDNLIADLEQSELGQKSNGHYKQYLEGMDQSGSSFYIENLKTDLYNQRTFDLKQKEMQKVHALNEHLKKAHKGSMSLKEIIVRGQSSLSTLDNDIVKVVNTSRGPKLILNRDQSLTMQSYGTRDTTSQSLAPKTSRLRLHSKSSLANVASFTNDSSRN